MTRKRHGILFDGRPHAEDEGVMSFGDHLDELRARLIYALAIPLPLFIIIFFFSNTLIDWLLLPLFAAQYANDVPQSVQELAPPEVLVTRLKLSVIAAIVVSIPWILWQLWLFIRPGLMQQERRFVRFLIPGSAILTAAGVALLYFVMLPLMLQVLIAFGNAITPPAPPTTTDPRIAAIVELGEMPELRIAPPAAEQLTEGDAWIEWPSMKLWLVEADAETGALTAIHVPAPPEPRISQVYRISWYVNFVLVLLLGMVVAFQMPLVLVILGWTGMVTPRWLRSRRRHAMLVCAAVSAIITPADAVSMLMMLFPLYGLFELGILLMVLAPAKKVAEGSVFKPTRPNDTVPRRSGTDRSDTDNPSSGPENAAQSAQPDRAEEQSKPTDQDQPDDADEPDGRER